MRIRGRSVSGRRAVAAVEFAIVLPLLVLLALGCVDFGRFLYQYIALTNAVQAGGFYGTLNPYTTSTYSAWVAQVQKLTKDEMEQQTGYVRDEMTVQVSVTVETNGLRRVRVTASYPFRSILPWPGLPSDVTLTQAVEMRSIR
jgi:Flp pilus assembly protein TadG